MIPTTTKNNTAEKPRGSTQALEADHNDVVASMNSIILSFGLPEMAGRMCFYQRKKLSKFLQNEDVRFELIKMKQRGNYILNSKSKWEMLVYPGNTRADEQGWRLRFVGDSCQPSRLSVGPGWSSIQAAIVDHCFCSFFGWRRNHRHRSFFA